MTVDPDHRRRPSPASLLIPLAEAYAWQRQALCRGEDSGIFFGIDGERGKARSARIRRAKTMCERCPVSTECLQFSLRFEEPFGVWGGVAEDERWSLLHGGRPRRSPTSSPPDDACHTAGRHQNSARMVPPTS
ncbi:WhiB family transcriptional regulator [Mycolicibacterium mageritense]|uniref:WhiB family transcriptional regulator n=1 Tax=Mycolicibacterium mageritense TaxID=53462 RepID=UPI00351A52EA